MIKKYKAFYYLALTLGVLGLLDIATKGYVAAHFDLSDMGIVSFGVLYGIAVLFGSAAIAGGVAVLVSMALSLSIIWFVVAYFFKKKIDNLENPSEENKHAQRKAFNWLAAAIGVLILIPILFSVLLIGGKNAVIVTVIAIFGLLSVVYIKRKKNKIVKGSQVSHK